MHPRFTRTHAIIAVLPGILALCSLCHRSALGCTAAVWDTYTSINGGSISSPTANQKVRCNTNVTCTLTGASDVDRKTPPGSTDPDTITYAWSSGGGGPFNRTDLSSVTWTTPDINSSGTDVVLSCRVNDLPKAIVSPDTGVRDDQFTDKTVTVRVVKPWWYTTPSGITGASISAPSSGTPIPVGAEVTCTIGNASDIDDRLDEYVSSSAANHNDTFTNSDAYTWSSGGIGAFKNGSNTGQSVVWVAPDTATASVTLTCTVQDDAAIPSGEGGDRDDPDVDRQVTFNVWDITIEECDSGWRPTGSQANPTTVGVTATISPSGLQSVIEFELLSRTSLTGYCTNAGSESGPDLTIEAQTGFNTNPTTKIWAGTQSQVSSATVTVTCSDYGAWSKIQAKATVGGVEQIAYVTDSDPRKYYATIPLDEDENGIADGWSHEGVNNDIDSTPSGVDSGDGYTRFEEYRGFMVNGYWTDTDPDDKDIFVYDRDSLGLDDFTALGLTVHGILNTEWNASTKSVNFNGDDDQDGILLVDGGWSNTLMGLCSSGPDIPNAVGTVYIFTERIRFECGSDSSTTTWEAADIDQKKTVVGHECGHAVAIDHHWYSGTTNCVMYQPFNVSNHPHVYCITSPGCTSAHALK